jgi:hypothetical protein
VDLIWIGTDLLSRGINPSTISAGELNDSVRNGKRWNLAAIGTNISSFASANYFSFNLPAQQGATGTTPLLREGPGEADKNMGRKQ